MSVRHIIGRQTIRLQTDRYQGAQQLQQAVSKAYWQRIVPVLERVFDRHAGPDVWIRLDSLEIDLGAIDLNMLEKSDLEALVAEKTEKALLDAIRSLPPQKVVRQSTAFHHFDLWLWWLQHGSLPWFSSAPETGWLDHVLETLGLDQSAVLRLSKIARQYPVVIRRIIRQHEESFLKALLELHTGQPQAVFLQLVQELKSALSRPKTGFSAGNIRDFELRIWETALSEAILLQKKWNRESFARLLLNDSSFHSAASALANQIRKKTVTYPELTALLEHADFTGEAAEQVKKSEKTGSVILPESGRPEPKNPQVNTAGEKTASSPAEKGHTESRPDLEKKRQAEASKNIENQIFTQQTTPADKYENIATPSSGEDSQYFIPNAGVVLLHTFLPRFFAKLGLLEQQDFKDEAARHRAVVLLHFLATGESRTPDYTLVLPKFLCAMPANLPLDHTISATPEEQGEAVALLSAAIEHWGALGATSPDGLREGFLQRPGKLTHTDTGWRLQVEQNTIDILLDRLPWNLNLIKLPWMPELLRTDWR